MSLQYLSSSGKMKSAMRKVKPLNTYRGLMPGCNTNGSRVCLAPSTNISHGPARNETRGGEHTDAAATARGQNLGRRVNGASSVALFRASPGQRPPPAALQQSPQTDGARSPVSMDELHRDAMKEAIQIQTGPTSPALEIRQSERWPLRHIISRYGHCTSQFDHNNQANNVQQKNAT